jgi:MSHA biogenesis protein MshO
MDNMPLDSKVTPPQTNGIACRCAGFTMIEMVMVMVITGILGAVVATFIGGPIQGYVESGRRAELTDIADTALRRISRDVHTALPNSIRVTSGNLFMEFLGTKTGALFQEQDVCFSSGCSSLVSFGSIIPEATITLNSDRVVINNFDNNDSGTCSNCSAYCSSGSALNNALITGATDGTNQDTLTFGAIKFCPSATANSQRFQVVEGPVTYVCSPTDSGGDGTLRRYWNYAIQPAQTSVDTVAELNALASVKSAILATNVSACSFTYIQRNDLLAIQLALTNPQQLNETVNLYYEVHVSNTP